MAHDTPPCHRAGHATLEAPIPSQRLAFGQDEGPHLACVRLPCYDVADIDDARRAALGPDGAAALTAALQGMGLAED